MKTYHFNTQHFSLSQLLSYVNNFFPEIKTKTISIYDKTDFQNPNIFFITHSKLNTHNAMHHINFFEEIHSSRKNLIELDATELASLITYYTSADINVRKLGYNIMHLLNYRSEEKLVCITHLYPFIYINNVINSYFGDNQIQWKKRTDSLIYNKLFEFYPKEKNKINSALEILSNEKQINFVRYRP